MRTQFTFAEVAKVFAQVGKVENAVEQYNGLNTEYDEINKKFDAEFAKYDYSFHNAPQELYELFDNKCAAIDKLTKAERKVYRVIKEFGALIGIGENYTDIIEDRVIDFINHRWGWLASEMVEKVKYLAKESARRININA